ncbi:multidrug resistance protein [Perilla frutescens var. frutescens]|nr:multidrug resistance protein [Perilla frutescens var. frutescens]
MNELNSGRGKAWSNMYSSSSNPSSQIDKEGPWKSFGSSMNAISFGFVATAILISMFLIMAIFEHLFRPNPSSTQMLKLRTPPQHLVQTSYASDFSVVMPGHHYPSFIAQPAPLPLPLPREQMHCPSHSLSLSLSHLTDQ